MPALFPVEFLGNFYGSLVKGESGAPGLPGFRGDDGIEGMPGIKGEIGGLHKTFSRTIKLIPSIPLYRHAKN